jgi:ABC-2 type transport system ATP-binding protein
LLFFANLKGVPSAEAARRIDRWLARMELTDWKDKKASELSKGMQQKVQFIATAVHEPELMILDEPFSGLDPVSVGLLKSVILDLKAQGKAIIFSTHQMEQVEQLCDDICLINHSTKVLSGNLKDVKRGFGKNVVRLDFEGPDSFLNDPLVKRVERYPNYVDVTLNEGASPQELLKRAMEAGVTVNKFESMEPSLNEIFIESVTGKNGKDSGNHQARVSSAG